MSFGIVELSNASTYEQILQQKALNISTNMQINWEFVRKALAAVQESPSKQANKDRTDISYIVGDKVWLSTKNITTD